MKAEGKLDLWSWCGDARWELMQAQAAIAPMNLAKFLLCEM